MRETMQTLGRFLAYIYQRFDEDGCSYMAASLAYSTLLSLVPLTMVSVLILSHFPIFQGTTQTIQQFILQNFVATSANVISEQLSKFIASIQVLSWTNILMLIVVSVLMMYNMVCAFNRIWQVKVQRHLALSFIIYVGILLITPIFFGVLLLISSYLASLPLISGTTADIFIKKPLLIILPYVAAFITFTFFNWVLPSAKVKLWHAAIAGFLTTVLFELAKYLFSLYLTYIPTYRLIYGALATIPLFLIWLYLCWLIILFGGIICKLLDRGLQASLNSLNK